MKRNRKGHFVEKRQKEQKVLGQAKVGKMCMYRNGMHLKECITYLTKMNQEKQLIQRQNALLMTYRILGKKVSDRLIVLPKILI
ncbi:unnamed protein product [Acanthoscelides obtectus]|uniref:Uncharacterized protein n=1 Tax=Acanthoscelides obtectus TaxID=200917 RepID=A0A9P0K272_ACAOB|nr:unnamed protein product [Acanthoscelides obtectus]CAK1623469.1 hypothetical protein AOBTE_LOCUS2021 [Acanthoscelides obtectus]